MIVTTNNSQSAHTTGYIHFMEELERLEGEGLGAFGV